VKAYPAETTEAFLDGHVSAFSFFGGVPVSIPVPASQVARIRAWVKYGMTGRHAVDFCGLPSTRRAHPLHRLTAISRYRKGSQRARFCTL